MKWLSLNETRIPEYAKLWNQELGVSFPIRERLLKQNIFDDVNLIPEGSGMVVDEQTGAIIGFVVAKVWNERIAEIDFGQEKGWIQVLLVDSNYRNQGIGTLLLNKAEAALRQYGVEHVSLGDDFYRRFFPGIPDECVSAKDWFGKRGYQFINHTHDLTENYSQGAVVDLPEFQGVCFKLAEHDDRQRITSFMSKCFPGEWEYQTLHYWEAGGTGREFVLMEKDGEIHGFCRINDSNSPLLAQNIYWSPLFQDEAGGIGPLGIDSSMRGFGYGLGIVQAGIHYLVQRNIRHIVIDTTRYIDFYQKLGYKIWKSYGIYNKELIKLN